MIRISEKYLVVQPLSILEVGVFKRSLGRYGHKYWSLYGSVEGVNCKGSCMAPWVGSVDSTRKSKCRGHAGYTIAILCAGSKWRRPLLCYSGGCVRVKAAQSNQVRQLFAGFVVTVYMR